MTITINIDEAPADWWAPARITPAGGGDPVEISVLWRYKDRAAAQDWWERVTAEDSGTPALLEVMAGWKGINREFSGDALEEVLNWSIPARRDFADAYVRALTRSRVKN